MGKRIDLSGKNFCDLAVNNFSHIDKGRATIWDCTCKCGAKVQARSSSLRNGTQKSCCLRNVCLVGRKQGKLKVEAAVGKRKGRVTCLCSCGKSKELYINDFLSGAYKSCGAHGCVEHSAIPRKPPNTIITDLHNSKILFDDGAVAIIDTEDVCKISGKRWRINEGYVHRSTAYGERLHRYLLDLSTDDAFVDHIDGDPLNNKKTNLRLCTHQQNCRNAGLSSRNTSGFKGVSQVGKKFRAYIVINGKQKSLGHYTTAEEAATAYNIASEKYFGEFARLNSITSPKS